MDKTSLNERDICTKFITPALRKAGWDEMVQVREEVSFTKGRIVVRGKVARFGLVELKVGARGTLVPRTLYDRVRLDISLTQPPRQIS